MFSPDDRPSDEQLKAMLKKADLEKNGYKKELTRKLVRDSGSDKSDYQKAYLYYKMVNCSRLQEITQELVALMPGRHRVLPWKIFSLASYSISFQKIQKRKKVALSWLSSRSQYKAVRLSSWIRYDTTTLFKQDKRFSWRFKLYNSSGRLLKIRHKILPKTWFKKKTQQFHYNHSETTISPKIIERRTKREREQEQGSKRLEIVVFCLFIGETYGTPRSFLRAVWFLKSSQIYKYKNII